MANSYYGRTNVIGVLSAAQAMPNATAADSTSMVEINPETAGKLKIAIFANTAIAVSTGNAFSIEIQTYSADTAASAISPFSTANNSGIPNASGTSEPDAHFYPIHKTSADGALAFSQYALIWEGHVPERMMKLLGHTHLQLVYNTDENLSAQKIDAIVFYED